MSCDHSYSDKGTSTGISYKLTFATPSSQPVGVRTEGEKGGREGGGGGGGGREGEGQRM